MPPNVLRHRERGHQVRDEDTVDGVQAADSPLFQAKEQGRNQVRGVASIAMPVINPRPAGRSRRRKRASQLNSGALHWAPLLRVRWELCANACHPLRRTAFSLCTPTLAGWMP
jgi:hypothetical protein